jgi:hypothetical protein
MWSSAEGCVARQEAALKGIFDAMQRLHDEMDAQAPSQCAEVIAICCSQIASIYGVLSGVVIQWLCDPAQGVVPPQVRAFVEERISRNLSQSQRHFLESMQQYLPSVNPHGIIIVNNVRMILLI